MSDRTTPVTTPEGDVGGMDERHNVKSSPDHSRAETHELSFEEYDLRVSLTHEGEVWVSFHESGRCAFTMSAADLGAVVSFVETHAQIKVTDDA